MNLSIRPVFQAQKLYFAAKKSDLPQLPEISRREQEGQDFRVFKGIFNYLDIVSQPDFDIPGFSALENAIRQGGKIANWPQRPSLAWILEQQAKVWYRPNPNYRGKQPEPMFKTDAERQAYFERNYQLCPRGGDVSELKEATFEQAIMMRYNQVETYVKGRYTEFFTTLYLGKTEEFKRVFNEGMPLNRPLLGKGLEIALTRGDHHAFIALKIEASKQGLSVVTALPSQPPHAIIRVLEDRPDDTQSEWSRKKILIRYGGNDYADIKKSTDAGTLMTHLLKNSTEYFGKPAKDVLIEVKDIPKFRTAYRFADPNAKKAIDEAAKKAGVDLAA